MLLWFFFFVLLMWYINLWYIDFLLLNYPCCWDKSHLVIVPLMWVQFGDTVDPHLCIPCLWILLHAKVICNPKMSIMVPSWLFMMLWKSWKIRVTWHAPLAEIDQGDTAFLFQHNCCEYWESAVFCWGFLLLYSPWYAGQEATVRTGHGTTDWFQIGKGVR